ncbi:nuclear transport factor 2 family protein [bacterium]|nr:nuclear transport factor 2 family protein [bacterium]
MESEMVVREAMACFGLGDEAAFLGFLHEDVHWQVHVSPPLDFGGVYAGRDEVRRYFREVHKQFQACGVLWSGSISDARQTAIYGMVSQRCLSTGCQDTTPFAHWFEVEDGRILAARRFLDSASLQRLVSGRPGLRPVARNAANSAEAMGVLAGAMRQSDDDEQTDIDWLLALYGADAPPRAIRLPEVADVNIEWQSAGLGSLPTGGPFYGRQSFARHMDAARQLLGPYQLLIEGQICQGNSLALHGSLLFGNADQPHSLSWFQALTVVSGQLQRGLEILDTQALVNLMEPSGTGQAST